MMDDFVFLIGADPNVVLAVDGNAAGALMPVIRIDGVPRCRRYSPGSE